MGDFGHMPLPSASQGHVPSLRHTPSVPSFKNIHTQPALDSPFFDCWNNVHFHNSQCIQLISPITFTTHNQVAPNFPATQHISLTLPHNHAPPTFVPLSQPQIASNNSNSYVTSSLPSTKNIPILTSKHDWGSWNSMVRTLILNANLLGYIADDPLPGAVFDPGLWPTYPFTVHQRSMSAEIQSFFKWWTG